MKDFSSLPCKVPPPFYKPKVSNHIRQHIYTGQEIRNDYYSKCPKIVFTILFFIIDSRRNVKPSTTIQAIYLVALDTILRFMQQKSERQFNRMLLAVARTSSLNTIQVGMLSPGDHSKKVKNASRAYMLLVSINHIKIKSAVWFEHQMCNLTDAFLSKG
jgi:hypothetical protein